MCVELGPDREEEPLTITFLGTSSCRFDRHDDTVHYVINESMMVDTGWFAVSNLTRLGIDPLAIKHLLFTHLHHDHYLGLPGFLFHLKCHRAWENTTVYGPAGDVQLVVALAEQLLQKDRFYPETPTVPVVELPEEGSLEMDGLTVAWVKAIHPVSARSYLFTDADGATIGITGDTAYNDRLVDFYRDCDLLIHEASLGAASADPGTNTALHSGAIDAALIAERAGARRLMLVHGSRSFHEAAAQAAREVYHGDVIWPEPGQKETISAGG